MNWKNGFRGLLVVVAAASFTIAGPVLAAGPAAGSHAGSAGAARPAACSPGTHACPIRISFAKGALSGQAHSHLSGVNARKWFVVNASAGQTMEVIVQGAGPTRGVVYFPGGGSDGQPGGRIYDGPAPTSGDYLIRVNESPMAEAWSGGVDVLVVIY